MAGDGWSAPEPLERLPVEPEQEVRFRRLLTELMVCLTGAPVFFFTAACIRPPLRHSPSPWLPLVLVGRAFACVVWMVLVLIRLAEPGGSRGGGKTGPR